MKRDSVRYQKRRSLTNVEFSIQKLTCRLWFDVFDTWVFKLRNKILPYYHSIYTNMNIWTFLPRVSKEGRSPTEDKEDHGQRNYLTILWQIVERSHNSTRLHIYNVYVIYIYISTYIVCVCVWELKHNYTGHSGLNTDHW